MKNVNVVVLMAVLLFLGLVVVAQEAGEAEEELGVTVQVVEDDSGIAYLVDQEGRALYLFLEDRLTEEGEELEEVALSTCYDQCAENWPPYTLRPPGDNPVAGEVAGNPVAGEGADQELLGEITREDTVAGMTQVTYNSWPLYYFAGDEEPGDTNGQGRGEVWYLVSPEGDPVELDAAPQEGEADSEDEASEVDQPQEDQADGEAGATVQIDESGTYGEHLVDAEGMALYVYLEDSADTSTCTEQCAQNWPPLIVEGEPSAGGGVDAGLLGTIERPDGAMQVTYNGRPLYRYVRDVEPGDTRGQNLGGVFYLVSPVGESITEEIAQEAAEVDEELLAELYSAGQQTFSSICAACHGAEGQGNIGPRFDGNSRLAESNFVINIILNGFPDHTMPAFRDQFSDREVAEVGTYIRNAWSNDFGVITEEEVSERR